MPAHHCLPQFVTKRGVHVLKVAPVDETPEKSGQETFATAELYELLGAGELFNQRTPAVVT